MFIPTLQDYYFAKSGNASGDGKVLQIGQLRLWYSYTTCVAFQIGDEPLVVARNCWSKTTARHIGAIPGSNDVDHIPYSEFQTRLSEALASFHP